jgi:DNA-damage-inducible protein J
MEMLLFVMCCIIFVYERRCFMPTTVLQVRMDEDLKNEAAKLFENLGIDIPTAIRIFFKRAVAEKGIPFELREPSAAYDASSGWKAFMDLRRQAQRGGAAGMSEEEIESEIAAYRAGK